MFRRGTFEARCEVRTDEVIHDGRVVDRSVHILATSPPMYTTRVNGLARGAWDLKVGQELSAEYSAVWA